MSDADVIVVGGGHNGLVCSAYLARAGLDTIVVEARSEVGGCASTVSDLAARFNICNCDHTMVRALPLIADLDLESHGLRYVEADPAFVHLGWDGYAPWMLFHDAERTIESIARSRPSQVSGYRRYLADAAPVADLMVEMAAARTTTPRMLRRILARRGRGAARLLKWSRASVLDIFGQYFDDEAMMLPAISTGPTVWGVAPDRSGTGLAAALYALRHRVKTGRPVGGSGVLTDALRRSLESAGGRVRCGERVASLITDGGAVAGVRLLSGRDIRAGCVVAACDPRLVAATWVETDDARCRRYRDRWQARAEPDGYESKIDAVVTEAPRYAALDGNIDLFADHDPNDSTFVISPTLAELAEAHRLRAQGRVADRPTMLSNVPSVLDASMRSDDGHHVLSLEALFTPYALEGGWPASAEPQRWLETWAQLVQPGFTDSIDRYRAMTPDRYEREFLMHRGHTPSYVGTPVQSFLGRQRDVSRYRTPIRGLYLSGAGTYPGAGVWGASGRNTAAAVLRSAA